MLPWKCLLNLLCSGTQSNKTQEAAAAVHKRSHARSTEGVPCTGCKIIIKREMGGIKSCNALGKKSSGQKHGESRSHPVQSCCRSRIKLTALCCNEPCSNYCLLAPCLFYFLIVMELRWLLFILTRHSKSVLDSV